MFSSSFLTFPYCVFFNEKKSPIYLGSNRLPIYLGNNFWSLRMVSASNDYMKVFFNCFLFLGKKKKLLSTSYVRLGNSATFMQSSMDRISWLIQKKHDKIGQKQEFNASKLVPLGHKLALGWGVVNHKILVKINFQWTKDSYYGLGNHHPHLFLYSFLCKGVGKNKSCVLPWYLSEL